MIIIFNVFIYSFFRIFAVKLLKNGAKKENNSYRLFCWTWGGFVQGWLLLALTQR